MTLYRCSLESELASLGLLPFDLRGCLHSARLLSFVSHDSRIVVLAIDHAWSDIIVTVASDCVLGTCAAQTSHHGILPSFGRPLQFLGLLLGVRQGFDGTATTNLSNLSICNLLLSWSRWLSTVDISTALKLILGSRWALRRRCKCVFVVLVREHLYARLLHASMA